MRDSQKRGQIFLVVVFGLLSVLIFGFPASVIAMQGTNVIKSASFRLLMANTIYSVAFFGTLGYLIWIGKSWAKWVVMFFTFITALITLGLVEGLNRAATGVIVAVIIMCFAITLMLGFSKDIASYIRYKGMKRKTSSSSGR